MNKDDLRTLGIQSLLIGGLVAGCVVLAAVIATQRPFVEKYIQEEYQALPARLKPIADAAAAGTVRDEEMAELSDADCLLLYDHWMNREAPGSHAYAKVLVAARPALYLARAERTLVCGSPGQRARALAFLEQSDAPDAAGILEKAAEWSARRKLPGVAAEIRGALGRLRGRLSETTDEANSTFL
jgi:hypothetical protein